MKSKHVILLTTALVALVFGSIFFSACARPGTATTGNGSSQSNSGNPSNGGGSASVHLGLTSFVQPSVTVSKGSMLMLIDDVQVPHIIMNGTWDASGNQHLSKEAGAPTVNANLNSNSVSIGPFNTAGTFHLLCTIHQGMNLTVVVQ